MLFNYFDSCWIPFVEYLEIPNQPEAVCVSMYVKNIYIAINLYDDTIYLLS